MENMKERFPKGQLVVGVGGGWAGIVVRAPRGKNAQIIECVEVFGVVHEMGSAYCREYVPATRDQWRAAMLRHGHNPDTVTVYFKGKTKGLGE